MKNIFLQIYQIVFIFCLLKSDLFFKSKVYRLMADRSDSSLDFQFNGVIVVSSAGSILPSGTKASRPAGHKVMGAESKNFACGSLGVIAGGATLISRP